jgi:hypothetical protein
MGPSVAGALFSAAFEIADPDNAAWFDPVLVRDNAVFVDPFLLDFSGEPEFKDASNELYEHFRVPFRMLAEDPRARTRDMLYFPELPETCLGYTERGTKGSGSGPHFAGEIRQAMLVSIKAGLKSPRHFEEMGLLSPGLGPDRISDITCRVLASRFVAYTERVAHELGIKVKEQRLWGYSRLNGLVNRVPVIGRLPVNPHNRRAILLVPKFVLRKLPTINRDDFEDYLWEAHSEELRSQFNVGVKKDLGPQVLRVARANPAWVRDYVGWEEQRGPRPYPFDIDPDGFGKVGRYWYNIGRSVEPPQGLSPTSAGEVLEFVRFLNHHFKTGIEKSRGYETLYSDKACTRPRSEKMAQRVYGLMARGVCELCGVAMSPETNAGSGPVDFKFSTNYHATVLVELKLLRNTRFWDGPGAQLPTYMTDHDATTGMFVAIAFTDKEVSSDRFTGLRSYVRQVAAASRLTLDSETVDARPTPSSASTRKATQPHP